MIERHILAWVKADEAADALREAAEWFRLRNPQKASELSARAAAARAEAMNEREAIIQHAVEKDRPSRQHHDKPSS